MEHFISPSSPATLVAVVLAPVWNSSGVLRQRRGCGCVELRWCAQATARSRSRRVGEVLVFLFLTTNASKVRNNTQRIKTYKRHKEGNQHSI